MGTDWSSKTVAELDEAGAEWEDYPVSANKADKVAFLEAAELSQEAEALGDDELADEAGAIAAEVAAAPDEGPPEGMEVIDPDTVSEEDLGAIPVVYAGTWVRLKEGGNVPEECWGHVGVITFAPVVHLEEGPLSPRPYEEQGEGKFIVHTRDEFGYDLQLEKTDFSAMSSAGRHEIISHG